MRQTLFALLLGARALSAFAPAESERRAEIPTGTRALELADLLRGGEVSQVLRIDDFRQREPSDGGPPSANTTAYLAYSESGLHVIFVCKDDPAKVRAHLSRRESISGDDLVGIAIDTYHDGRRAYQFYANPLGVQLDGIVTEGQADDYKFDTVWSSDGQITPDGFIVRITIPFKSIRARMGPGRTWGIALTRRITRNNEYDTWPRISDRVEAYVPQFATVNAPSRTSSRTSAALNPYGFLASRQFLDENAPPMRRENELRGGIDSTILFGDSIGLDLTANPDFSQVESDEPQITVNRRYEVYFPEKRPFFLENAALLQTPEPLFFSRRIRNPEFGVRATGKVGPWGFAALAIDDRAGMPGEETGPRARIGVFRIQRELGRESTIGALFTTRNTADSNNEVGGLDVRWKPTAHWIFTAQAVLSTTSRPGIRQKGSDLYGDLRYAGRHVTYSTTLRDRSPGFVSDLGFIPRSDIRQAETEFAYRWRPERGRVTSFGPSAYALVTYNHAGQLQDWSLEVPFTINFRGPSSFSVSHIAANEVYQGRRFRRDGNRAVLSTDRWKRFGMTVSLASARAINYYPSEGKAPFGGAGTDAGFEMTFHISPRIRLDESYFYSRLASGGKSVLDDHVARSKINVQFTRSMSVRFILDYNGTLSHPESIGLDRTKRVTGDFLFTYLIHPGTALYAGYNDRRENWLSPASGSGSLSQGGGPWFTSGRQVFVKFSYFFHL